MDMIANVNGQDSFAYVGAPGWHGKGQKLEAGATMEQWAKAAGLDFEVKRATAQYMTDDHGMRTADGDVVLYRSDTGARVGMVRDGYQIVQPIDALEFFREFCERGHLTMETAGALKGGSVFWAMAKTGRDANFSKTAVADVIEQYVLLSTSVDTSRATNASENTTRVVCMNTLRASDSTATKLVKTVHSKKFDANATAASLGLVDLDASWNKFREQMLALQGVGFNPEEATAFFSNLLRPAKQRAQARNAQEFAELLTGSATISEPEPSTRAIRGLADLEMSYVSAPGACPGSAYGVLQAVTHFVDHVRGNDDKRQLSAMFGQGDSLKSEAFAQLLAKV